MSNSVPPAPSDRKPVHWPSLVMVVLGMGGIMLLLGVAGAGLVGGILSLSTPMIGAGDAPQLFSYAVGGVFLGGLLLSAVVMGIQRLGGRSGESLPPLFECALQMLHPRKTMGLYPLVILLGWWLDRYTAVNWLFMPVLNMIALGLPVAWLVWLGTRGFEPRSAQRNWSALGVGMTLGPALIFMLEMVVLVIGLIVIGIGASSLSRAASPVLQEVLRTLEQFGSTGEISEQAITHLLQNPLVIAALLVFISGVVPVVEEIFKPVAVWAMWNRPLTPQDGWTLGLLSGAGFALMENFGNVAVGEGWTFIVLARVGATALHMFNTALIGYTFVLARQKKRIMLSFFALAVAMLVHAAWNAMTVFAMVSSLESPLEGGIWPLRYILLMALMSLSLMGGIVLVNRQLANRGLDHPAEEMSVPETEETGSPAENLEN